MKHLSWLMIALLTAAALALRYAPGADAEEAARTREPEAEVVELGLLPTAVPEEVHPEAAETPSPQKTPLPELPAYDYPGRDVDARCLARFFYSVIPDAAGEQGKEAAAWVVLNRLDDGSGKFADSVRYILLQRGEFLGYDPEARRTPENEALAERVLNAWMHEKLTGDAGYRLVPQAGVYMSFSEDRTRITIRDAAKNVVYSMENTEG